MLDDKMEGIAYFKLRKLQMMPFRKSLLFLLFIGLALAFASCDSGGTGNSGPIWVGEWRVTESSGLSPEERPPGEYYFSITQSTWTDIFEDEEQSGCEINKFEVVDSGPNRVTLEVGDKLVEYRVDVSDGLMTVVNQEEKDNTWEAEPLNDDPRELAGC